MAKYDQVDAVLQRYFPNSLKADIPLKKGSGIKRFWYANDCFKRKYNYFLKLSKHSYRQMTIKKNYIQSPHFKHQLYRTDAGGC